MSNQVINNHGRDELWAWFSLSYSSWLTLPRSMMHEMPDDWQMKMAELLKQWDDHWDFSSVRLNPIVNLQKDGKFTKSPEWLINYRHPKSNEIAKLKKALNHES